MPSNRSPAAYLLVLGGVVLCGLARVPAYAQTPDPALVAHYTFDADPGGREPDRSSFGNDGQVVNGQWFEELDGRRGVLRFDGETSYIDLGDADSLQMDGDMTLEMWARQYRPQTTQWALIFGDAPTLSFAFYIAYWHTLALWYGIGGPEHEDTVVPVERGLLNDEWGHIAMVVEYPRCRFYRDGELVRDAYLPVPAITRLERRPLHIGGVGRAFCPLDLDEFRLYRRALSAAEVAAHARDEQAPPAPAEELAVEPDWYEGTVALRLVSKNRDCAGHSAEIALLGEGGVAALPPERVAMSESGEGSGRWVATASFPLQRLADRRLEAVARVRDPAGTAIATARREVVLKKPAWINTPEGWSDEVLPPWTPVEAAMRSGGAVEVRVWGRRHIFGATPFPAQIRTRDAEMLAAPISLTARADGEAIAWEGGQATLADASETAATVKQACAAEAAEVRVSTTIEYDGFMVFDCEVEARRDLTLDELTLEMPLVARHATLCYGDRVLPRVAGIPMGEWYSGAVTGDLSFRFSPCIWLGDEERGLCWQAESDEDWRYADPQRAIEILPRGEVTIFRAHLVDVPTPLVTGEALHYRFALLATPVKPMLRDSWDLRIARTEPLGADLDLPDRVTEDGQPTLEHWRELGIRYLYVNCNDAWPYPMPIHKQFSDALHRMIDAAHAAGLKIYPYLIHQRFPTMLPEFDIYGLRMCRRPLSQYICPGPPPEGLWRPGPVSAAWGADSQGTAMVCPKSRELQDAYVHALAMRLDIYGDDGVYLDGTVHMPSCENLAHGCGYIAADGSLHRTYPVFAIREYMRRIYTVVKQRRPDGVIDVHCSWGYNPSALAYADVLWNGEQWAHFARAHPEHVFPHLTLDKFRTEFMGYQLGVAAETLFYRLGTRPQVAATSLLHDVPVRVNTGDPPYLARIVKLWRVRDEFGADAAEKLFYWQNADYVQLSPEGCYALLLRHPTNGVLAFVSNLTPDAQSVTVHFSLDRLGLQGRPLKAFDALTDEPIALSADGSLTVPLGSEEWLYIWLRPTDATGEQ